MATLFEAITNIHDRYTEAKGVDRREAERLEEVLTELYGYMDLYYIALNNSDSAGIATQIAEIEALLADEDITLDPGTPFPQGTPQLTSTKTNIVVPVIDGTPDYTDSSFTVSMILSGGDDTSNWSFSKVDNSTTSSLAGETVTITDLSGDTGSIDITASRSGYTDQTLTVFCYKISGSVGNGWTGGSYNASNGIVTFTSDDGLGFSTSDLRGIDGDDGLGWTGGSYDGGTGIVTFASDDGLGFQTGDLRGDAVVDASSLDGITTELNDSNEIRVKHLAVGELFDDSVVSPDSLNFAQSSFCFGDSNIAGLDVDFDAAEDWRRFNDYTLYVAQDLTSKYINNYYLVYKDDDGRYIFFRGANITYDSSFTYIETSEGSGSTIFSTVTAGEIAILVQNTFSIGDSLGVFGKSNFVGGRLYNFAIGDLNKITGGLCSGSIALNRSNTLVDTNASLAVNSNNTVSHDNCFVHGTNAVSRHDITAVYASGEITDNGDVQSEHAVLYTSTTDATPTELLIGASGRLTLPTNSVMTFDIDVTAAQSAGGGSGSVGDNHSWKVFGTIRNFGGTTAIQDTVEVIAEKNNGAGSSSWTLTVNADDTNNSLRLLGTGQAGKNLKWIANAKLTFVSFLNW